MRELNGFKFLARKRPTRGQNCKEAPWRASINIGPSIDGPIIINLPASDEFDALQKAVRFVKAQPLQDGEGVNSGGEG